MQSIVDYSVIPAIDQKFFKMSEEDAWYWSGTTHLDGPPGHKGNAGACVAFGKATGSMKIPPQSGKLSLMDVHGAGAQRSDPKVGNLNDYPQGDVVRIYNLVRCVRDAN